MTDHSLNWTSIDDAPVDWGKLHFKIPRTCTRDVAPLMGHKGYFGVRSRRVYGVIVETAPHVNLMGEREIWYRVLTTRLENIWFRWIDRLDD